MARQVAVVVAFVGGLSGCYGPCRQTGTTLMYGLTSQAPTDQVKAQLGVTNKWVVDARRLEPSDARPRADFTRIDIGERSHLGFSGDVTLVFFNDRLYGIYFATDDIPGYEAAVRRLAGAWVDASGLVHLPDHTVVQRLGGGVGKPQIWWYDSCLAAEHEGWIARFAWNQGRPTSACS